MGWRGWQKFADEILRAHTTREYLKVFCCWNFNHNIIKRISYKGVRGVIKLWKTKTFGMTSDKIFSS